MMDSVNGALVLRALDDAVRVTVAELNTTDGVPEIVHAPLAGVMDSPFGSRGDVEQDTIEPPVFVATSGVTAVPTIPERLDAFRLSTGAELPTLRRKRRNALP